MNTFALWSHATNNKTLLDNALKSEYYSKATTELDFRVSNYFCFFCPLGAKITLIEADVSLGKCLK